MDERKITILYNVLYVFIGLQICPIMSKSGAFRVDSDLIRQIFGVPFDVKVNTYNF